MGTCKYCGIKAGFLRKAHSDCKRNHESGKVEIIDLLSSAIEGAMSLDKISDQVIQVAEKNYIHKNEMLDIYALGFDKAMQRILDDNLISIEAENSINDYMSKFDLNSDDLNKKGSYSKLIMSITLRELSQGKLPVLNNQISGNNPFMFQKNEQLIWVFTDPVEYYEQTSRTTYQGGYAGVSFRVAKGVYVRSGGFRGNPVKTTEMKYVSKGYLAITSKHIYFSSSLKSLRIQIPKIITLENFEDGVGLQKEGVTSRPIVFKGLDGWFVYNTISYLSQI